jgi:KRAB domain-containing zinc finger protein
MKKKHMSAEVFKCGTCKKTLKTKPNLKVHQMSHQKAFKCDVCGHKFARKNHSFIDHLIHHFNPKAFQCDICHRNFRSRRNMKKHKIAVHQIIQQPRKFECQICQMRFKTSSILSLHHKVHQDRKTCDICHKQITASSFQYHMKTHELKKHEKKFECQVCQKKFFTKQLLRCHSKSHEKPFECDLCGHRVAFKQNLRRHINVHLISQKIW